jgi:hypothetical protein
MRPDFQIMAMCRKPKDSIMTKKKIHPETRGRKKLSEPSVKVPVIFRAEEFRRFKGYMSANGNTIAAQVAKAAILREMARYEAMLQMLPGLEVKR